MSLTALRPKLVIISHMDQHENQRCVQAIIGCYKSCRQAPRYTVPLHQVVPALVYFNLPVDRWPLGAQLYQRVMDQHAKAAAAASQIIAAMKSKLTKASDTEFDMMSGMVSSPTDLAQQSDWRFTITLEQEVYGIISGWDMQRKHVCITPSMHAALATAAAAELLAFNCDRHRLSYGFIDVSLKMS